jgi:hypothetical protein
MKAFASNLAFTGLMSRAPVSRVSILNLPSSQLAAGQIIRPQYVLEHGPSYFILRRIGSIVAFSACHGIRLARYNTGTAYFTCCDPSRPDLYSTPTRPNPEVSGCSIRVQLRSPSSPTSLKECITSCSFAI